MSSLESRKIVPNVMSLRAPALGSASGLVKLLPVEATDNSGISNGRQLVHQSVPVLSGCYQINVINVGQNRPLYNLEPVSLIMPELEKELRNVFFNKDLHRLRSSLEAGKLGLHSLNSRGQSLITFAQFCLHEEAVIFLARQGCVVTRENVEICSSWNRYSEEAFQMLCSAAQSELADSPIDDIFVDLDMTISLPTRFESYLDHMVDITSLSDSDLFGSALLVEARAWSYILDDIRNKALSRKKKAQMQRQRNRWEGLMRWTIDQGAHLHYIDKNGYSIFACLAGSFHPLDGQDIINEWIHFLNSCAVDLTQYIEVEAELYKDRGMSDVIRNRVVKVAFEPYKLPSVEVSWFVDPHGPVALVLDEFSDFGDDASFLFEVWPVDRGWSVTWPFRPILRRKL